MKPWAWDRRSKFWNKFYITFNIPHFLKDGWMKAWWQRLHFRDNNATIQSYCSFSPEMTWIRMFFKGCLPQISLAVQCEELVKYLPYCTRHPAITSIYKKWQNKQINKKSKNLWWNISGFLQIESLENQFWMKLRNLILRTFLVWSLFCLIRL